MSLVLAPKNLSEFFQLWKKYSNEIDKGSYVVSVGGILKNYNNYESRLATDKINVEIIHNIPKSIQKQLLTQTYHTGKTIIGSLTKHTDILYDLKNKSPNLLSPYNINNPPEILEHFATSKYSSDKEAVIMNPATSLELLQALSYEPSIRIRENIVFNPNATANIIRHYLRGCDTRYFEKNLHIRRALKSHKNAPSDLKWEATSVQTILDYDCFIATAVYGGKFTSELYVLRDFRDKTLSKTELGRLFIRFYYLISPKISKVVKRNKLLRKMIKFVILDPFVKYLEKKPVYNNGYK